ncbi:MAG: DUF6159 family protein [Phycisphaerales bacterium]
MFEKVSRSWELTKQSWSVLRSDKTLVLFPVFSSIALLAVVGSFMIPATIWFTSLSAEQQEQLKEGRTSAVALVITFGFYFVSYFVMTYFNVALVGAARERFAGRPATLSSGLGVANSRLLQILAWASLSATVGMILRMLEERAGLIGRIVIRLIGVAWAIGTYFVVPILAIEGLGPIDSIKRSVSLLKKSWGEAALTRLGTGAVFGLITMIVLLVSVGLVVLTAANGLVVLAIMIGAAAVISLIAISLIGTTLQAILQVAVYNFAADGSVPAGFDANTLQSMFQPKKKAAK